MREVRLPSLGAEMEEGTLLEWYVKPGDTIAYGDVIALLDTEKAEIEMEAFESGVIESLLIEPGQTVAVGTAIATLVGADAGPGAERPRSVAPPAPPEHEATREAEYETEPVPVHVPEPEPVPVHAPESSRRRATPLARRLARVRGINLDRLTGSGPGGAITQADIPAETSAPRRSAPPETSEGQARPSHRSRRREIIAAAMVRSKREIPHYYLSTAMEVERATDWIAATNQGRSIDDRVLLPALLIKCVANAAGRHTTINGHYREDGFHPSEAVHVGMVVSLRDGGVVIPTLRNAQQKSVAELTAELRDIVGRARAGRLRSGELGEATISVTSLGDNGAETIFGVIYPPQVAIVGFGGIHPALRAEGDLHGTRSVVNATLSADHRVSDGQEGSRFLESVARNLKNPEKA